ncbi:MAG: hypothetical protein ACOCV3_00385 [Halanaerobiales bacterium]
MIKLRRKKAFKTTKNLLNIFKENITVKSAYSWKYLPIYKYVFTTCGEK